jgi:hypothetical protein
MQPLVFFVDGPLTSPEALTEEFPYRQTQALIITLDEIEAWIEQAKICFCTVRLPCMDAHREWLDLVLNHTLDMRDALNEEEDKDLIACRLTADDPLVEALLTVLDNCPDRDEITERQRSEAVGETLASLTSFWIQHIQMLLIRLLSTVTGDGEVLAIIHRQETLAKLHF